MNDDQNNSITLLINHLLLLPRIWARLARGAGACGMGGGGVGVAMAALMTPPHVLFVLALLKLRVPKQVDKCKTSDLSLLLCCEVVFKCLMSLTVIQCEGSNKVASRLALNSTYSIKTNWNKR